MTRPVAPFGQRLRDVFDGLGHLCVGIDPHDHLLDAWGLDNSPAGLREFGLRVVDSAVGVVGIVKPQIAFFERFGSAGYAALEDVLTAARESSLIVIADAKRGDIGSSVDAYGAAWLEPGSPLEADAVTLAAYTGTGSLHGVFDLASRHGKGAFVLAATSNPESLAVQSSLVAEGNRTGSTVAGLVAAELDDYNRARSAGAHLVSAPVGSIGVVLGATKNLLDYGVDVHSLGESRPLLPVLAPGFGHQGATFGDARTVFGPLVASTIVSTSRAALAAGPAKLRDALSQQASELAGALS
ncbi:orotidine-5'-phosphate decarboxylase [Agreia sp. COWG]|uniref:orotidine-5'-phosphate decarboxylase n=1 Tax=Agreia sp. COWG TaxID=2773266 RepID=UPI001AF4CC66|nr:orotidine-5'-phosphate decarboxylase [Agreia sp. COWG]CAD5998395.1 Orotidine 5'-phosphate decarboxylase [Agreia sp. COWG]